MNTRSTKALIIGGGPGGYVCAIRLAQLGIKPLLIEKENIGGTCLNSGCSPSKAIISAAKLAGKIREAGSWGIRVGEVAIDFPALLDWKNEVVRKLINGIGVLLKGNAVEVIAGHATFRSAHTVEVTTQTGQIEITAENIVIATGSVPAELPNFSPDGKRVLDSTQALNMEALPRQLVVLGGGYIGLELGSAYAKLGSNVVIVEMLDQVLPGLDPEIARLLERRFKRSGGALYLGSRATGWSEGPEGIQVEIAAAGTTKTLPCDKIIVSVGRRPASSGLNLAAAGLALDPQGFLPVDKQMRTAMAGIFAIGDLAGNPMLAHKASREGEVAAEVIAGLPASWDNRCIPAVVFSDPEVATVGLMEHEARGQGRNIKVGKFPFAALGRALTAQETEGFVKVVLASDTEEILGVAIVGPNASDLVAEAALAIEMGALYPDLALTVHAHPTLPEALREALLAAKGGAIHALKLPATANR
ncbi:MAG: dihydrolipoyl dehydrogenase [Cyanobacteria bacterium NC_groundwater_1444_Ag_S-0.65um_54_12]|nr:dihydrolipoyl dehydrogenase [Cyanobacteria bacterium NC_groundwater_1444_Ag_S-0.65um_54_12]